MDDSGNVTDSYDLEAFGVALGSSGSTTNPHRFGGAWGYMTEGSGLLQLGHRFYWPELGRFITQDPIGDGMNWYEYVDGNPVTRIDPEGMDWLDDASNISSGFADTITFGLTGLAQQAMGTRDFVNPKSGMYAAGGWAGVGWSVAMGGAAGEVALTGKSTWLGTLARHKPHHGLGRHLQLIIRTGRHSNKTLLWLETAKIPPFLARVVGWGSAVAAGLLGSEAGGSEDPC